MVQLPVLGLSALLLCCGAVTPIMAGGSIASAAAPGDDSTRELIELQLDVLFGLVPEREVQEYYRSRQVAYEGVVADCMDEAGFTYTPRVSSAPAIATSGSAFAQEWGFGLFTQLQPEFGQGGSSPVRDVDPNQRHIEAMSEAERNAFFVVLEDCFGSVALPEAGLMADAAFESQIEEFLAWVEAEPSVVAARSDWAVCMAEAGHPYQDEAAMLEHWHGEQFALLERFEQSSAWRDDSPDHSEWLAAVEMERAVASAAAECDVALEAAYRDVRLSCCFRGSCGGLPAG